MPNASIGVFVLPVATSSATTAPVPGPSQSLTASHAQLSRELRRLTIEAAARFAFVSVGAQDASRADPAFLSEFACAAREAGAFRLRVSDTVGILTPSRTRRFIESLELVVHGLELEFHGHNDLGLAAGNTLAALEEVVMALRVGCGIDCGVATHGLSHLSQLVARASGRALHAAKPVTGEAAFQHESGIHCAGLLRDRATYEPFPSALVGRDGSSFRIGGHSGSAALANAARDCGLNLDAAELAALLEDVRRFARRTKATVGPEHLRALVAARRRCAESLGA